jgi:prevent-host-death family protein
MKTLNMHEAKLHLSQLLERVRETGEPVISAQAGRPIAQVIAIDAQEPAPQRRLGLLAGGIEVPVSPPPGWRVGTTQ